MRELGIAILPPALLEDDVKAGRLLKVLNEYDPLEVPFFAVCPERAHLRGAVRAFVEFVAERFDG